MIKVELIGLDKVKQALADLTGEFRPAQLRAILDAPGRLVVNSAKQKVPFSGEIAEAFKKDLGVYRDRRKAAAAVEWILIGPRFKAYTINGHEQKVAIIAQHMTEGFKQTDRKTKGGLLRGRVASRSQNPMVLGYEAVKGEVNQSINESIVKNINKVKSKYRNIAG